MCKSRSVLFEFLWFQSCVNFFKGVKERHNRQTNHNNNIFLQEMHCTLRLQGILRKPGTENMLHTPYRPVSRAAVQADRTGWGLLVGKTPRCSCRITSIESSITKCAFMTGLGLKTPNILLLTTDLVDWVHTSFKSQGYFVNKEEELFERRIFLTANVCVLNNTMFKHILEQSKNTRMNIILDGKRYFF